MPHAGISAHELNLQIAQGFSCFMSGKGRFFTIGSAQSGQWLLAVLAPTGLVHKSVYRECTYKLPELSGSVLVASLTAKHVPKCMGLPPTQT